MLYSLGFAVCALWLMVYDVGFHSLLVLGQDDGKCATHVDDVRFGVCGLWFAVWGAQHMPCRIWGGHMGDLLTCQAYQPAAASRQPPTCLL